MSELVLKQTLDPAERLEQLIARFDTRLARVFRQLIDMAFDNTSLEELETLIIQGRLDEAVSIATRAGSLLADEVVIAYIAAARDTADLLANSLNQVVSFDQTNFRAVNQLRLDRNRIIRGFSQEQDQVIRDALSDAVSRGLNPTQQARAIRESIGLTLNQNRSVRRYRRLLETNSILALRRELRSKRFDDEVLTAIENGTVLSNSRIDRLVNAYRRNYIRYRSEVISRTESLRAVHQGSEEMYQQAIDEGLVNPSSLVRRWVTAGDERVRGSHASMHGQVQPVNQPFISGEGNSLRYPGDPNAPASEVIQCRCVIATRIE